jgi:hypothetical protein
MAEPSPPEDCLVCLQPTSERSPTLFLYNCTCIYAIHATCFRDWRRQTNTSRICLICHEGLDTFDSDEEELPLVAVQQPIVLPPQQQPYYPDDWARRQQESKNLCLFTTFVFITLLLFSALMQVRPTPVTEPVPIRPHQQFLLLP